LDAAVDSTGPTQTVACPFPTAVTTNAIAPLPPVIIKLPLCVLPEKCCYADVGSGGTCAEHATACGLGIDTFQCDGPEDCTDGTVCCGYTTGAITTQAIVPIPITPTTNTVCTTDQKCAQLTGRTVCHAVSDCGQVLTCTAGGGLPAPYKVCGPGKIILPPPVN
jgi:hypothetical protein